MQPRVEVRQAVILAAGLGTRMLPLTKAIPKALLPLGMKPAIHRLVEECISSGVDDIVIVVSAHSRVKDYFSRAQWLYEHIREKRDKQALRNLKALDRLKPLLRFVVQEPLLGEVHALSKALPSLKRAPFAVLFSDNLFRGRLPATLEAIRLFRRHGKHVKSNGRYVFHASIMDSLKRLPYKSAYQDNPRGIDFVWVFDQLTEGQDYLETLASGRRYNIGDAHAYFTAFPAFARDFKARKTE